MDMYFHYIFFQILLLLSFLNIPANASQIWQGTGRVISGMGEGGSVELHLEVDGETVRSLLGPPLEGKIQKSPTIDVVIKTQTGKWQIQQCGEELCINLQHYNPKQVIFYRLQLQKLWRDY